MSLSSYFKSGKGRGLRIVLILSLLISVVFGLYSFQVVGQIIHSPMVTNFVDSIPAFDIKDHAIQQTDLRWSRLIPLTQPPLVAVIDTSIDTISLPVPDGVYVTRNHLFSVQNHAMEVTDREFASDLQVSPAYVHEFLRSLQKYSALMIAGFTFFISWIGFLIEVLLTTFLAWLLRQNRSNKRVWRMSAVTWGIGLVSSIALVFVGWILSTWAVVFIATFVNLVILARLKN